MPTPTGTPTDPVRDRTRMPLIDLIAAGALDEEYVEVARRRAAATPDLDGAGAGGTGSGQPGPRRSPRPGPLAAIGVAVFAVLVTLAFQQTRDNESVVDASRATLEERIRARRDVVAAAQAEIVRLRTDNAAAESNLDILDEADDVAAARVARLRAQAGLSPATGEGVRIEVGDNPDGELRNRVYDEDLALLVNGLWRAGATAVSVNGNRLTVLSGFRFSGQAIRLNELNVSLSPPYTVLALGDTATLAADLLDTSTYLRFLARGDQFGFTVDVQNEQQLTLPAAPERLATGLRSARTGSDEADIPTPTPTRKEDPS